MFSIEFFIGYLSAFLNGKVTFFKMLCNVRMEQHRNSSPTNQIHYSDNGPQHLLDLAIASLKILTECSTVSFSNSVIYENTSLR